MKINYNVQGKQRKELVNIIANAISTEAVYEKAPTYNFTIGAFTVTKDGVLEFDSTHDEEQIRTVMNALKSGGFTYEDSDSLSFGYPREGFTDDMLDNLCKMILTKESLIKKALGVDGLPLEIGETELTFTWFRTGLSREETYALSQFICQLCKTAKAKTRVTAKAQESFDNEKFAMRVWLISLGMKGEEFKLARKMLLENLDGNSGFRYGKPEDGTTRQRRDGVQREVVSVRFTPETLEKLAELASQSHMSRNQLIESVICEYVQGEFPTTENEEGFNAVSNEDGESQE